MMNEVDLEPYTSGCFTIAKILMNNIELLYNYFFLAIIINLGDFFTSYLPKV